jgi:hypothetical protein
LGDESQLQAGGNTFRDSTIHGVGTFIAFGA